MLVMLDAGGFTLSLPNNFGDGVLDSMLACTNCVCACMCASHMVNAGAGARAGVRRGVLASSQDSKGVVSNEARASGQQSTCVRREGAPPQVD